MLSFRFVSSLRKVSKRMISTLASESSAGSSNAFENCRYEIPLRVPINMFCGLPVRVATLPALEAKASASR